MPKINTEIPFTCTDISNSSDNLTPVLTSLAPRDSRSSSQVVCTKYNSDIINTQWTNKKVITQKTMDSSGINELRPHSAKVAVKGNRPETTRRCENTFLML